MYAVGLLALAAFSLRVVLAWVAPDSPPVADMSQYHNHAVFMLDNRAFGPDALRGPGYPSMLAAAYALLGESNWAGRTANALIGALLTVLTALLARAMGAGPRAGWAAGIVAVYPGFLLSSLYQMPDTFYALLLVLCLLVMRGRGYGAAAALGALLGLALLTRSVALVLLPTVAVSWALVALKERIPLPRLLGRTALATLACGLVLWPWLSFTAKVTGRPVLDTTSGYNALVGSNPRATGRLELEHGAWLVETYMLGAASVADAELQGMRAAFQWARENPTRWAGLAVLKTAYLWGLEGREHSALYSRNYFGTRSTAAVTLWGLAVILAFPVLVVSAVIGLLAVRSYHDPTLVAVATVVGVTTVLHVLSFGESRFHLPFVPLLAATATLGTPTWSHVGRAPRALAALMALSLLTWAWAWQFPGMWQRLDTIRQPQGSFSVIDY